MEWASWISTWWIATTSLAARSSTSWRHGRTNSLALWPKRWHWMSSRRIHSVRSGCYRTSRALTMPWGRRCLTIWWASRRREDLSRMLEWMRRKSSLARMTSLLMIKDSRTYSSEERGQTAIAHCGKKKDSRFTQYFLNIKIYSNSYNYTI